MKQIKVRCTASFQEFNQGKLTCEVNEGDELIAELHKDSEEYYAVDSYGREVYVGYLNFNGEVEFNGKGLIQIEY